MIPGDANKRAKSQCQCHIFIAARNDPITKGNVMRNMIATIRASQPHKDPKLSAIPIDPITIIARPYAKLAKTHKRNKGPCA